MLKPVFSFFTSRDYDGVGGFSPHFSIGPLVIVGMRIGVVLWVITIMNLTIGVWYDSGED